MTEDERIEKMITQVIDDLGDKLKKLKPGDPAHMEITAALVTAMKSLEEHREHMRKKK